MNGVSLIVNYFSYLVCVVFRRPCFIQCKNGNPTAILGKNAAELESFLLSAENRMPPWSRNRFVENDLSLS